MIEANKSELASAMTALGKLICRTSPLALCKSIKIEAEDRILRLSTCNLTESVSFELETESEDEFSCIVGFDEFRDAVKGGRNKTVEIVFEADVLQVGDRHLISARGVEWPDISPKVEAPSCLLPENVVGMFAKAAQIVDRNEPREILRGINLSADGITATNGKELLNYNTPLELESSITIPLPLALMQSKATHAGLLFYWPMKDRTGFSLIVGPWRWTVKALAGNYPNWKQVIPEESSLTRSISFLPEAGQELAMFLKNVPDAMPHNAVELADGNDNTLDVRAAGLGTTIEAELKGDWKDSLFISKTMLLRLLQAGHTKIELGDSFSPILATGGAGRYIAMPLHQRTPEPVTAAPAEPVIEQPHTTDQKERETMIDTNTTVVSAPVQTVAPKQEPETNLNPLDDLGMAIESFKAKMKASFDEVAALARKVKEAQIAQKQKERDFIQARRAIERIRMVSGF